jgi:ABC-type transport system involved in multi-copper enzyme maturation permease subunit
MNKLISLELKRNGLKFYHYAVVIITAVMLFFLYLLAFLPKLEPSESDLGMFMTYHNLINLNNIICMVIFIIFSSVMFSKFIVEEYSGKRAILLFSYPVNRNKILEAKIFMVFSYTVIAMFLCGAVELGIFFITESQFPLCTDHMTIMTVLGSYLSLLCYSLLAGIWGIVALRIGFEKQSVTVNIITAVIIATIMCQIMAIILNTSGVVIFLVIGTFTSAVTLHDLKQKVMKMEV